MRSFLVLLFVVSIISCSKDDNVLSTNHKYLDFSNYFPLEIGNSWIYESNNLVEWAIVQRSIIDTLMDQNNHLFYKAKWGLLNYPNNEHIPEYYYWGESGLYKYYCGIEDTCMDQLGNYLPPYYRLLIKSPSYLGESWNQNPDWIANAKIVQVSLQDSIRIKTEFGSIICDTIFYEVLVVKASSSTNNEINESIEYYAPDFGLVEMISISGNDTTYHLKLLGYELY